MSEYKVFIRDFPARCEKLLNRIEKGHRLDDLTVTGLLMVASAAVNIPLERLRAIPENGMPHPSGDYEKYAEAAEQFNQLLKSNFIGSCLYPISVPGDWRLARKKPEQGRPNDWNGFEEIGKDKNIDFVLLVIRNALAHGNIFTRSGSTIAEGKLGKNNHTEIQEILFVSAKIERVKGVKKDGKIEHYNCISVTPAAFKQFLDRWFTFINGLEIYPYIVDYFEEVDINAANG